MTVKTSMNVSRTGRLSLLGSFSLMCIWGYISAVFLLSESWITFHFGSLMWFVTCLLLGIITYTISMRVLEKHKTLAGSYKNVSFLVIISFVSLILLDITFSIYLNYTVGKSDSRDESVIDVDYNRQTDAHIWMGELYPKLYYPTARNFRLHKPGVSITGMHFGAYYDSVMRNSSTLVNSVLELHKETITINKDGFRDPTLVEDARIFSLGDSLTFGWGVNEESSWPAILEKSIGQPVYNLGVHDASPKQELELLKYILQTHKKSIHIECLLWMIYEGNDLIDNYDDFHRSPKTGEKIKRSLTKNTLVSYVGKLPSIIKKQSVINRFRTGELVFRVPEVGNARKDPGVVDGIRINYNLYNSPKLGFSLFARHHIERGKMSKDDVLNHPNRVKLEKVFQEMASLAREHGFEVTVLLAPTSVRLHGPYFTDFPDISPKPYFLEFVADLTEKHGFRKVDLFSQLKPYANDELLYFRDDDHFNEAGNALVAKLIQDNIFINLSRNTQWR